MKDNIPDLYKSISLTHKVKLLPIKSIGAKKTLIEKTVTDNLSVRGLEMEILKIKDPQKKGLLTILNNYQEIMDKSNFELLNLEALKKASPNKLDGIKKKIATKTEDTKNMLENLKEDIKRHNEYIERYKTISSDVDKALKYKKENKKVSAKQIDTDTEPKG